MQVHIKNIVFFIYIVLLCNHPVYTERTVFLVLVTVNFAMCLFQFLLSVLCLASCVLWAFVCVCADMRC